MLPVRHFGHLLLTNIRTLTSKVLATLASCHAKRFLGVRRVLLPHLHHAVGFSNRPSLLSSVRFFRFARPSRSAPSAHFDGPQWVSTTSKEPISGSTDAYARGSCELGFPQQRTSLPQPTVAAYREAPHVEEDPPTLHQLRLVLLTSCIPFIGFGFVDNFFMILLGDEGVCSVGYDPRCIFRILDDGRCCFGELNE